MKGLKILALATGALILLTAVLATLAFTPAVQTWAVRRALPVEAGAAIEIGNLAAGLSSAEITDLRIAQNGVTVSIPRLSARYSAMEFLRHKRVSAETIRLRDVVIDLRNPSTKQSSAGVQGGSTPKTAATGKGASKSQSPVPTGSSAFEGLLKEAQLPLDIKIDRITTNGRILLPEDRVATFELDGANIENGKRGGVTWKADFADPKPAAPLRAARASGVAAITIAGDRRITRLETDVTASVEGPKLPREQIKLEVAAAQSPAGAGESYNVLLGIVRDSGLEPLLKSDAAFDAAAREISGSWTLTLGDRSASILLSGLGLPDLTGNGSGKFRLNPATHEVGASGQLDASASQLQKVSPDLAAIGAVRLRALFDGGMAGDTARLDKLQLEITSIDGRKFAQIDTAQRITFNSANQRVTMLNAKSELARITLKELPIAWAQPFLTGLKIEQGTLSVVLAVEAEADGSRVRARAIEPVSLGRVTVRDGVTKLLDQVTLTTSPSVDFEVGKSLSAELGALKITMPAGDTLAGKASVAISNLATKPVVVFGTRLEASIVAALKPYLPIETGPLAVVVDASGRLEGNMLQIMKMATKASRPDGSLLAAVELLQETKADLAKKTFAVAKPADPMARLQLGEIPLNWAQSYLPGYELSGLLSSGVLEVTASSLEQVTLNTTAPVVARGISASNGGKPMLKGLDLAANVTATKKGDSIAFAARSLEVTQGKDSIATLSATGNAQLAPKLSMTAKGTLNADAGAVLNQPVLAPFATLSRGRVNTAFEVAYGETIDAKAAIAASGLTARSNNQALGDIEFTLSAAIKPDGSGSLNLPLTLNNTGRRSDVTIVGTFGRAGSAHTFNGKVTSNQLFVDDFQLLGALAPASEPAKSSTAARAPTRDAEAFWAGVSGRADMNLKKVLYGKDYTISAIQGSATLTPTRLALEKLEGQFKEKPFKLTAGINFAPQQPKPYTLAAAADIQGLDIGEILRAANPREKPVFETKAALTALLNGNGGNVTDLFKNAYGKFELTGTQGVTRLLARRGGAGAAVNVASIGLALLGASRQSEGFSAAAELTQLLNEVRFDNVKVQIERAADLSFKLTAIEIMSPLLRTSGTGSVASKSSDDVANAAMNIVLQLGAKGQLAYALQRSGLLSDKVDDKGYALMSRTFAIGGTPSKPDNAALWGILLETALNAFGR